MSENEAWVATDDPTEGDLPATEFMGSKKDVEQTVEPQEGDGSEVTSDQDPNLAAKTEAEQEAGE